MRGRRPPDRWVSASVTLGGSPTAILVKCSVVMQTPSCAGAPCADRLRGWLATVEPSRRIGGRLAPVMRQLSSADWNRLKCRWSLHLLDRADDVIDGAHRDGARIQIGHEINERRDRDLGVELTISACSRMMRARHSGPRETNGSVLVSVYERSSRARRTDPRAPGAGSACGPPPRAARRGRSGRARPRPPEDTAARPCSCGWPVKLWFCPTQRMNGEP